MGRCDHNWSVISQAVKNVCEAKKHVHDLLHPSPTQVVFVLRGGSGSGVYTAWWYPELIHFRSNGMLLKNLPSSVVLPVNAGNEMPRASITLPNIKETFIYPCLENQRENQHQREPPTETIWCYKEYLAEALEGENLTGTQVLRAVQPYSLQFKRSKSTIIMHRGIQSINWCFVFAFFFTLH